MHLTEDTDFQDSFRRSVIMKAKSDTIYRRMHPFDERRRGSDIRRGSNAGAVHCAQARNTKQWRFKIQ